MKLNQIPFFCLAHSVWENGVQQRGKWKVLHVSYTTIQSTVPFTRKHTLFLNGKKTKTTGAIWKMLEIVDSLKPKCALGVHTAMSVNGTFLVLFREKVNQGPTTSARKTV